MGMYESTHSPEAGNGSQADHKRNNNTIQTPKFSQYITRSAGKSKQINLIFLKITSILVSASSWTLEPCYLKTSQTFTFVPYVKSAEKLLH